MLTQQVKPATLNLVERPSTRPVIYPGMLRVRAVSFMKSIYIVYGISGEYSDRRDWDICAYPTKKLAKAHAAFAQQRAQELFINDQGRLALPDGSNQYDRFMSVYDSDVQYSVFKLDLRSTLPRPV